ncbi:hypothetical protein Bpfe_021353 [Biomphalaria pfeifferi]|uniref:C2H2-type domain-containing protein n=1 Tax=Biomphalaria pfeifferi TaxID=112525 RepID=A0AAD8B9K5_BIOPF|nr:hypothetical protein Bpfe_021353 [Biomphalaria pfeifferi]
MSETLEELEGDCDFVDDFKEWEILNSASNVSEQQKSSSTGEKKHNENERQKQISTEESKSQENSSIVRLKHDAKSKTLLKAKLPNTDNPRSKALPRDEPRKLDSSKSSEKDSTKKVPAHSKSETSTNILDYFEKVEADRSKSEAKTNTHVPKTASSSNSSPQIAAGKKHKLPTKDLVEAKVRKTEFQSEIKGADIKNPKISAAESEEKKEKDSLQQKTQEIFAEANLPEKMVEKKTGDTSVNKIVPELAKVPVLSEAEYRSLDNELVEGMMDDLKQQLISHQGDKYIVRFSPVELADLADPSIQGFIQTQPNLTFYFKRQGKFKKKKGYAESYFTQSIEVQAFLQKFLQVKLVEPKVEVSISYLHGQKEPEILSFTALLDKNGSLLKLVKIFEDSKPKTDSKESFDVNNVPAQATTLILKTLFPFCKSIALPNERIVYKNQNFKGATKVFYPSEPWIEAVLECCIDFKYRAQPLAVVFKSKDAIVKKEASSEPKMNSSVDAKKEAVGSNQNDKASNDDKNIFSSLSGKNTHDADADISSMTLDVCSGMLESLNKLKKLGTNNPDVLKILEMQTQIASLHQSLSQSVKTSSSLDPWSVGPSDTLDSDSSSDQQERLSKRRKKKQEEEKRMMKQLKEMEDIQKMIDEADEESRQKEENIKRLREQDQLKTKSGEEKKSKLNWARKIIEEAKLTGGSPTGDSSKQEAQRMLRAREERLKEEEEAKKREELKKLIFLDVKTEEMKQEIQQTLKQEETTQETSNQEGTSEETNKNSEKVKLETYQEKSQSSTTSENSTNECVIYSETEYNQMVASNTVLPSQYFIQLGYFNNRQCPVQCCPATKFFKTAASFMDHWEIFHKPNVTMRFCPKCSAYFMNISELESHLSKRHSYTDLKVINRITQEARVKVVSNPSFRDPGRFVGPVI